jgi:hypothetical protein
MKTKPDSGVEAIFCCKIIIITLSLNLVTDGT